MYYYYATTMLLYSSLVILTGHCLTEYKSHASAWGVKNDCYINQVKYFRFY